jgi:chromosome segregation ATPase
MHADPQDRVMSAAAPQTPQPASKHRGPWPWIALALAVVAVGLLVWALVLRSDRDDAQQQASNSVNAVAQLKQANDDLSEQLGVTSEDLGAAQQDVKEAEQARQDAEDQADAAAQKAADAQKQVDAANEQAAQATSDSERSAAQAAEAEAQAQAAQAQADQSKADADAADARGQVVADCAKAYASAIGGIFGTDDREAAVADAKAKIADITDDCQAALGET